MTVTIDTTNVKVDTTRIVREPVYNGDKLLFVRTTVFVQGSCTFESDPDEDGP